MFKVNSSLLSKIKKNAIFTKEHGREYGFNKKYKFGIIKENNKETYFLNPKIIEKSNPILIQNTMYYKDLLFEAETEYGTFEKRLIVIYIHSDGEENIPLIDLESIHIQNIINKLA